MYLKAINLTLAIVTQEIEYALEEYPEYPYQVAFSLPELRQKLISHILSHIPNRYKVVENVEERQDPNHLYLPIQQRLHIEMIVRGGILHILRENADWVGRQISPKQNPDGAIYN